MEVIRHTEYPFPDDLEGRINSISNIINTELKAVTMLHLDDVPADEHDIKERIRETVGNDIYLPQKRAFGEYGKRTLVPIGAVAEEEILYENPEEIIVGYKLTEAGKKYGRPIAAFTLNYVNNTNQSMYSILGQTSSSGRTRSPFNSWQIMEFLREHFGCKFNFLSKNLGFSRGGAENNLERLHNIGFVEFESCGELRKGYSVVKYKWLSRKNPSDLNNHYTPSGQKISRILCERGESDASEISKIARFRLYRVISVLSSLVRDGFAERIKWGDYRLSEAKISEKGKRFLTEYIEVVEDALQEGPSLREMKECYDELVRNNIRFKKLCRTAVNLYTRISPSINSKPIEDTQDKIKIFLRENSGARYRDIEKAIPLTAASLYLTPLLRAKALRKEKRGREVRYYLND